MKGTGFNFKEELYIFRRRLMAFGNSVCFFLCRVFPIDNKKISVCTFEGKGGFGCNPKYIVQKLHEKDPSLKFVWFVKDMDREFPPYITKVPYGVRSRAYHLATSRIWIDNYRKPFGTIKRKGQYYLNTWHGTAGFKSIGLWRGDAFSKMAYLVSKNDSDMIDNVTSDSRWCDEVFPKGMLFDGEFLRTGSPRCDILFGDRTKAKEVFKEKFGIDPERRLLLYAPTYREKSTNGVRSVSKDLGSLDAKRLLSNLEKKTGCKWTMVKRLHPQIAGSMDPTERGKGDGDIVDASFEPDMYEVLAAADMLITDYSSVAMEAGFMEIPVILYADDLTQYMKERGGEQWHFTADSNVPVKNNREMMPNLDLELPFPISQNNDELEERILSFDEQKYLDKVHAFKKELELVFDGRASERVADVILEKMK